jgi:hypothetical protein
MKTSHITHYAICLKNKNCEDLVVRKIYPVLLDEKAWKEKYLRTGGCLKKRLILHVLFSGWNGEIHSIR